MGKYLFPITSIVVSTVLYRSVFILYYRYIYIIYLQQPLSVRFTKAERELASARPFGYGPQKFYESSHLVASQKKTDEKTKEETPEVVAEKAEDGKEDKKIKRLYVAVTSDRGLPKQIKL